MPEPTDPHLTDPALTASLDAAFEHLLAARATCGLQMPESIPTAVLEAAAARSELHQELQRDAADAVVMLLSAVENDPEMVELVLDAESALRALVSAGTDLGWAFGSSVHER